MNDEIREIPKTPGYDSFSQPYIDRGELPPHEKKKSEHMRELIGDRKFKRCLDVGCGIGNMTRVLADRCDKVHAIDIDPEKLRYISNLLVNILHQPPEKFSFDAVDLEKVDFSPQYVQDLLGESQFDLIIFTDVIYYLSKETRLKVVKGIEEMLDPSTGLLLITQHAAKISERNEFRSIYESRNLWLVLEEVFYANPTFWVFQIFSRYSSLTGFHAVNEG